METWNAARLERFVREQWGGEAFGVIRQVDAWLARGDGVAVYRNHDLGSPRCGAPKLVSFGSPDALLETGSPPQTLPDGIPAGAVNWMFQLDAVCREGGDTT